MGPISSQKWFGRFLPEAVLGFILALNLNSQTGNGIIFTIIGSKNFFNKIFPIWSLKFPHLVRGFYKGVQKQEMD